MIGPDPIRTLTRCALAIAMAILGSTAAHAQENFAEYDTLCGYQIIYWPTRHMALSHVTPDGREVIILDPLLQRGEETARRVFLTAHECAHHRMGHSDPASVARRISHRGEVADQELSADCWAAETLAKAGFAAELEEIAVKFYQSGGASPGNGYPSGIQRALMIKRCRDAALMPPTGKVRQIARNGAILTIVE